MGENGRSWFYLTLWRGTPPEFTTDLSAQIGESDLALVRIQAAQAAAASIGTASHGHAAIPHTEAAGADVITVTEVNWRVG